MTYMQVLVPQTLTETYFYGRFYDLFQPKTKLFSTLALILVHFKNVHYFLEPNVSLFLYLKNALHNLVIELCSTPLFLQKYCTVIY